MEKIVEAKQAMETIPSHYHSIENIDGEFDYWVEDIEGEIPLDLNGTFFRNGPGRMRLNGETYGHWFDGDGMIAATTFKEGKAHFRNKFIRTNKYIKETQENKICYRGIGTMRSGLKIKNAFQPPANVANTHLAMHAGKMLALWEGGNPYEIDPKTLDTVGIYNFDGRLNRNDGFSAHGKLNTKTNHYINFGFGVNGINSSGPKYCLNLYKVSPNGRLVQKGNFRVPGLSFYHDFAMTENYAVFFINSITMTNTFKAFMGLQSYADCINYDSKLPCAVIVVELDTFKVVEEFAIDPMVAVHFGNGFEKDGLIHLDVIRAQNPDLDFAKDIFNSGVVIDSSAIGEEGAKSEHYRYTIDLSQGSIKGQPSNADSLACEFPQWDTRFTGQETRYSYTASYKENGSSKWFNCIQKFDSKTNQLKLYEFGPGRYTGEILFAPRTPTSSRKSLVKEGDGYLIAMVYNAWTRKSEVVILDADKLDKELARIKLTHHVPQGFHGIFTSEVYV